MRASTLSWAPAYTKKNHRWQSCALGQKDVQPGYAVLIPNHLHYLWVQLTLPLGDSVARVSVCFFGLPGRFMVLREVNCECTHVRNRWAKWLSDLITQMVYVKGCWGAFCSNEDVVALDVGNSPPWGGCSSGGRASTEVVFTDWKVSGLIPWLPQSACQLSLGKILTPFAPVSLLLSYSLSIFKYISSYIFHVLELHYLPLPLPLLLCVFSLVFRH